MEIIAVVFSLISVWLTAKKNILCWPIGIIGILSYFYVFKDVNNWSNMSLQIVFLIQSIIGWCFWKNHKEEHVSTLSKYRVIKVSISLISLSTLLYFINLKLNGVNPILDSVTTGLSIVGMYLLSLKKIESWIVWIICDILYITLFICDELYLSSSIYFIFLIIAISGYISWRKELKQT